jgi:hypothetical protein
MPGVQIPSEVIQTFTVAGGSSLHQALATPGPTVRGVITHISLQYRAGASVAVTQFAFTVSDPVAGTLAKFLYGNSATGASTIDGSDIDEEVRLIGGEGNALVVDSGGALPANSSLAVIITYHFEG